ncbi:MAG: hypothetical protein ACRDRP_21845 [Pseudonocardiaceae bacterium]
MTRVFVSYASEDVAMACEVHRWLVEVGRGVFLDQNPRHGIAIGERKCGESLGQPLAGCGLARGRAQRLDPLPGRLSAVAQARRADIKIGSGPDAVGELGHAVLLAEPGEPRCEGSLHETSRAHLRVRRLFGRRA